MKKPKEFTIREFHWRDGSITYDVVDGGFEPRSNERVFKVREIMLDDETWSECPCGNKLSTEQDQASGVCANCR